MRKEIFIAITLGIVIGFVVVFGVITARGALNKHQASTPQNSSSSGLSPTLSPVTDTSVAVEEPEDGSVVTADHVKLRGTTSPKSHVVISGEKGDMIIAADESGSFSQDLPLVSGANEIRVVSFSPSGDRSEAMITIVFSTADF